MVEKKGYTISDIYQGGFSSMDSPTGVLDNYALKDPISTGSLGMTTDPRNANILQEVSTKLSMGVKNIEIEAVMPEVFDSIPKQQLKEIHRLTKLTGIDVSLHGPVAGLNVAGISQQGGFNEATREENERKVINTLIRAKELRPDGNIPVNFHTSEGLPMSQLLPPKERKPGEEQYKKLLVINRDSGQMTQLEEETFYRPGEKELKPGVRKQDISRMGRQYESGKLSEEELIKSEKRYYRDVPLEKGVLRTPTQRVRIMNHSEWQNSLSQLFFNKERADEILEKNRALIQHLSNKDIVPTAIQEEAKMKANAAKRYLDDLHLQMENIFSKAYEFGTDKQKKELGIINEEFKKDLEKRPDILGQSKAFSNILEKLDNQSLAPNKWVPLEEFTIEKTTQTFGNAIFETYKKFKGKNVPILTIENPPAGQALSTGKDVRSVVEGSRKQFIKRAIEEGMSKGKAEKEAEKLIGATWDVGHINMLRKYGYEEKDIVKESEEVAHLIKHVHLSDNFGFEHTELPMGMGNVPLKEIMEKLGKKGYDAVKVIEAAGWWQHFKTPPFQETIQAIGSPIYGMKMAPYWSQANELQESYFGGFGNMLPQINYETFGAGFSRLPQELGGASPGAQGSRMGGNPMQ